MDNDNKINEENLVLEEKNEIHQKVMLFLGEELENIHKSSQKQIYDIEKEYDKTKKHKSPFVALILAGCFVVVIGISFMIHKIVTVKNSEIQVSLQKFDDLNLKGLLDTVSSAQSNYDNAVKTKTTIEANMESKLKTASETYENDIFILDSLKLSKTQYDNRLEKIKKQYNENVSEIHKEFDESIAQAEKQIQEYKKQLAEFDTAKIEAAREQEKALNSERQLRKLETEKLTKEYEERIAEINNSMEEMRIKNSEEMRNTVLEVTNKYQAEIDTLDPQLNDENANSIIQEVSMYDVENFTGKQMFDESEIYSEKIENAVKAYQNLYDEYDYIDKTVASIPQKKSIPQYVKTSRSLVNAMGKAFYNTTMSLYDETVELNLEIDDLNEEIEQRNQKIEEKNQEIKKINVEFDEERKNLENEYQKNLTNQQKEYEETLACFMGLQNISAIFLGVKIKAVYNEINLTEEEIQQETQIRFNTKKAEYETQKENARQNYLAQKRQNEYEMQNEISLDEQNQVSSQQSEQIENEEFQKQQKNDSIINNNEDLNSKNDEQEFVFEIPSDDEILEQVRAQIPLTKTVVENLTEIEVFVAPRAHYLITEEGVNAEIKTAKPIKGKIFKSDDGKFVFEISPDKNGVIPAVNFEEIDKGVPIKILSK